MDRLAYALIGAVFGIVLAGVCWWLYGLAFSLRYDGPGVDPQLTHWIKILGCLFAALGFLLKDKVGSIAGDALAAIFGFETDRSPTGPVSWWQAVFTLAIVAGLIWFLTAAQ